MQKDIAAFNATVTATVEPGLRSIWKTAIANELAVPHGDSTHSFTGKVFTISADKQGVVHKQILFTQ